MTLSVGNRLGIEKDLNKHDMMTKRELPLGEHRIVLRLFWFVALSNSDFQQLLQSHCHSCSRQSQQPRNRFFCSPQTSLVSYIFFLGASQSQVRGLLVHSSLVPPQLASKHPS